MIIRRDTYLEKLKQLEGVRTIKIVTGIRRCGKTFLLFNLFREHLREEGISDDHVLEYRMDLLDNINLKDGVALYNEIKSRMIDGLRYYILIDEVQNVEGFRDVLNSLLCIDNADLYVTGSNSRFLSSDIATEFRGRGMEVRVHPLSFREYVDATGASPRDCIRDYMMYGGMPETLQYADPAMKVDYLKTLMTKVYLTDIVERNGIRNDADLEGLVDVLCSSIGSLVSVSKITNTMRTVDRSSVTDKTVKSYLDYICDSFLFERSRRYDIKGRRYFDSQSKYYISDIGLKNARENFRQAERTHIMENIIYNELRIAGYDVDVGKVGTTVTEDGRRKAVDMEVDFVANRGSERIYIQSVYAIGEDNLIREKRPLKIVGDSFKKVIVVNDDIRPTYDQDGILWVGLLEFLMDPRCISDRCILG